MGRGVEKVQILINLLVVLDTLILGFGVYMVVTAKPVRSSREGNSTKGKDPVKAAFEFEIEDFPKAKRKTKKTGTTRKENSSTAKKTSRRVV